MGPRTQSGYLLLADISGYTFFIADTELEHANIAISTFVATAWGLIALAIPHKYAGIELHSVGHVNHSAAYIAISVGASLAALISYWSQLSLRQRLAGATMLFIFGVGLILAFGALISMVAAPFFGAYSDRIRTRWRWRRWRSIRIFSLHPRIARHLP